MLEEANHEDSVAEPNVGFTVYVRAGSVSFFWVSVGFGFFSIDLKVGFCIGFTAISVSVSVF